MVVPITTLPPKSVADLFSDRLDSHPPWFNPSLFLSPDFDPESYIDNLKTFVPFDTLRSELQSHLSSLNHDLIDLINRDYTDFVNLSTNLADVDAAVVRMRAPILELRGKIQGYRTAVYNLLVALRTGLAQRSEAAAAREVLELLIDTSHVVSKVEKLIKELPILPFDCTDGDVNGANLRETQSMLLERIASEMNRLKFNVARAQDLPFVQNMGKRIESASVLLDASLGHCFVDGLENRDASAIYNCLRAYAVIDNTGSAEELFRSTVVAPMIQRIIPHGSSGVVVGASEDELEFDYEQVKKCVEKDCKFLLEISSTENSGLHVFDFLANSILKEVLSAIQKGKPNAFSPGIPKKFLKNYKSSLDFLDHLEGYCPSRAAVVKFRAEPVYAEFMKQWNIGVYFSIRFQEIAGAMENSLAMSSIVTVQNSHSDGNSRGLTLKQSCTLLESLRSCWSEDVFLISCADKFLRLSLQLISRYSNWLSTGLAARKTGDAISNPGCEWAISASPDDLVYIIHDINWLAEYISGDYLENILQLLSACPSEVLDLVKQSIVQSGNSLRDLLPSVINTIIISLVDKSVKDLRPFEEISALYTMKRELPPYVSEILRPLKSFLDGEAAKTYLSEDVKRRLLQEATTEITERYYNWADKLVTKASQTEATLQRLQKSAQKLPGASLKQNVSSYTDKILKQLFLDAQEYGRNLAAFGVEASVVPAYMLLWQMVAPSDKQNDIQF